MRYVGGNRLTLLRNGVEYFPALVQAIDAARSELFLETYIFADDETGSLVADALARAAARGVAVRLLLDGFGARDFAPRFGAALRSAGAEVLVFRPERSPWRLRRARLRRMHRKLASIDGRVGFVGGINVIDDYDTPGQTPPRYDYAVRIEGPLTEQLRAAAARQWAQVSWATFRRRWPGLRRFATRAGPPNPASIASGQRAALAVRDSLRHRRDIEDGYLALIAGAREEIVIACAYFFPGRRFRRALADAARRGVKVVLLLQGRVEYALLHYASRALYGTLLEAGIEIHEYHLSFLHAKVAVFDRRVASVGSSNIDPFSLMLAREANVFVDDAGFAQELRASLADAQRSGARALPPQQWKRQRLWLRVRIWIAYGIARLLISLAGYEGYH
ncbi:MAG TPA: cardiolipin synthase ClsB [Burkholderiales bacterium]|nr:cardiolipin synthase ClsB [Burkholderiales bacterium]